MPRKQPMDRGAFHGFARHMRSLEGGPAGNCDRASVWRDTATSGTVLESADSTDDVIGFVRELRNYFDKLRPMEASWHGERRPFIYKDLMTTERVFVRHDAPKTTLQSTYDGPYSAISRGEKSFVVLVHGRNTTISIDHLKLAYIIAGKSEREGMPGCVGRPSRRNTQDVDPERAENPPPSSDRLGAGMTRSDRRVRFPDCF